MQPIDNYKKAKIVPNIENLFSLIKDHCNIKKCKSFKKYGEICPDYGDCPLLRGKLKEWNTIFFPDRPCNKCLLRETCIEKKLLKDEINCRKFNQFLVNHKLKYRKVDNVLYPELLYYYDLWLCRDRFDDKVSIIERYYCDYINKPYFPKGILVF